MPLVFENEDGILTAQHTTLVPDKLNKKLRAEVFGMQRVFDAQGDVTFVERNGVLVALHCQHPVFAIMRVLDQKFGIVRISLSNAALRGLQDASRQQWRNALSPLQLPHLSDENIDAFQKTLLRSLWQQFGVTSLASWFAEVQGIFSSDATAAGFVKQYFLGSAVDEAIGIFREFLRLSVENRLDYSAEDATLKSIQFLFTDSYFLDQSEENLKLKYIKELLRKLLVLVSPAFIVNAICVAEDKKVIVSADDADQVGGVPFVKANLPLAKVQSLDALYSSNEYFEFVIQQYLALVSPLQLLIVLYNNEWFRFASNSEDIKYLLALTEYPLLMNACATLLIEPRQVKAYVVSIIQCIKDNDDFTAKTVELLQQMVVSYLKHSGILSLPLFDPDLPTADKYRQALWFLIAALENSSLYLTNLTFDQKSNCKDFSHYLRYVGLVPTDVRRVSLAELVEDQACPPEHIIASVLTVENIEFALKVHQKGERTFKFSYEQGLLVFIDNTQAVGERFGDKANRILQKLVMIQDDHLEPLCFHPSFLGYTAQEVKVYAIGIASLTEVQLFSCNRHRFIAAPVFNIEETIIPRIECLDNSAIQTVSVFAVRFPKTIFFSGFSPNDTSVLPLFPVENLLAPMDGLEENFLRPFCGSLQRLFSRKENERLSMQDQRNILAMLMLIRNHSDVQYPREWSEISSTILRKGSEVYLTYDGHFVNKGLEWLRFYGFSVLSVALGLFCWYHPAAGDQDLRYLIEPDLAKMLLASNPPYDVFSAALIAGGGGGLVVAFGVYEFFCFTRWLKSLCSRHADESIVEKILKQAFNVREPMLIARLAEAAKALHNPENPVEIYKILLDIAQQMKSLERQTPAINSMLQALVSGVDIFVSERSRMVRQGFTIAVRATAPPMLAWIIYSAFKVSKTIDESPIHNASTLFLSVIAKMGAVLAGNYTVKDPGFTPIVAIFLMFMLFNPSWLDLALRVVRSITASAIELGGAVANSRGGQAVAAGWAQCKARLFPCNRRNELPVHVNDGSVNDDDRAVHSPLLPGLPRKT